MRRLKLVLLSLVFCTATVAKAAAPVLMPAPPQLAAKAWILIDANSGKVLVEHNADQELPPASLTKMMTSYIISEEIAAGRLSEDTLVQVSENAWRKGGFKSGSSTMALEPRMEVKVIDLMRGVIIQSGNDASIALAEHVAGSEEAFADVMNQQAHLLGMTHSNYANSTGWPAPGHLTTARDLAILAQAVINDHPEHYAIYAEKYFKFNGINQPNRNKLLFRNKFVDGLKTGYTKESGYCLVASEKRNDMRLISVVLGTKSKEARAAESQRLLAYGFRYFETYNLYSKNQVVPDLSQRVWGGAVDSVDLMLANDVVATIPRGARDKLSLESEIDTVIKAPVQAGQELGLLRLKLDGELVAEAPLLAASSVEEAGFFSRMWDELILMIEG
ncbi:D-alanyl-D-alanine carboxypeptidase family protein [Agaribacterium haliotis]|uniref:D-alanyl-D-alanine carboxypeptidase family protein n=1 Tax=Agaribacterium haliotis TaxID=2013869 RepID=UPI000BB56A27|nr:D-alanyl-D-alanine carboxypeptidase family protein [Agaribacterium haliotis]